MSNLIRKIKIDYRSKAQLFLIGVLILLISTACTIVQQPTINPSSETSLQSDVIIGESYNSKEDVSLYIHIFETLPPNYIIKQEAQEMGWVASKGNLWEVTDSLIIGGDRFGNREKLLPEIAGRQYYECDVNYNGGFRGAERLVYSNDGLIFYTSDHYATFTEILFEEGN